MLFRSFNCRSRTASIAQVGLLTNPLLAAAVMVSAAIHTAALAVPALRPVFRSDHAWSSREFWALAAFTLLPIPVVEFGKRLGLVGPRGGVRR